jgi:DNA replication and repair protein RecF
VVRLVLTNFRSYESASAELSTDPVVLTGANGTGKTNVLEALSMLAPGRGLRRAPLNELTNQKTSSPWAVAARVSDADGEVMLGTSVAGDGSERRVVHVDGAAASGPGVLSEYISLGWLTPAMDRLFLDAASGRRRFLDRLALILHPGHGRSVNAYEKVMRERNALLETGVNTNPSWANALEAQMAEHGVAIAATRRDLLANLVSHIENSVEGAFPKALLALDGDVEQDLAEMSATRAEDVFRERLARNRPRDAAAGRALQGPHRTDLLVTHSAKSMAAENCSTGEQKALLIGLILAHAELAKTLSGRAPILLLDEVAAHLDRLRRAALFDQLVDLDAQCWLTGTDAEMFEALRGRAQFFTVFDGQLNGPKQNQKSTN